MCGPFSKLPEVFNYSKMDKHEVEADHRGRKRRARREERLRTMGIEARRVAKSGPCGF